jgi:hypothetical protein
MKKIKIDIENCYGIRKLQAELDFSKKKANAIYAPNGAMKTSLAQTFKDIQEGKQSGDRIFPNRISKRLITDENGGELSKDNVFVIWPYEDQDDIGQTEKSATLLVNTELREEYIKLHKDIEKSKEIFLKAMKEQSKSKRRDLETEIASAFTPSNDLRIALTRIKDEMLSQEDAPFAEIKYDVIFDDKVLDVLSNTDVRSAIETYIKKYNQLLEGSTYFKRGVFNYYNAKTIAKSLADNGFFNAKHTVNLNAQEKLEITSQKQLEQLIQNEKDGITNDPDLKKKFADIEKAIERNAAVREFQAYIGSHEEILPELVNLRSFKEKLWKSYFKAHIDLYNNLVEQYQKSERRRTEIEEEAKRQRTQWEEVIDIFNSRFIVPFLLETKNRVSVILGYEKIPTLLFTFVEGKEQAPVERSSLLNVLSTGERRAFYLLNIIFEIEARKKVQQDTVLIVDDIADSFDYKNKYAIIQYLKDIAKEQCFNQIILTHNFDFFRTVNSRFVDYPHTYMAVKKHNGIALELAKGVHKPFSKDWKLCFFDDPRKKIASIPFIRNLIEYTKGEEYPEFKKLTSLLHWKKDSQDITIKDLDDMFSAVCCMTCPSSHNGLGKVVDLIQDEAKKCLTATEGINLENKIVLSIAIRLTAERFMVGKIKDDVFVDNIKSNQTADLVDKFKKSFPNDTDAIKLLDLVTLMTPENIHLNSFMYEPILDMSDEHLRKLYTDIIKLK